MSLLLQIHIWLPCLSVARPDTDDPSLSPEWLRLEWFIPLKLARHKDKHFLIGWLRLLLIAEQFQLYIPPPCNLSTPSYKSLRWSHSDKTLWSSHFDGSPCCNSLNKITPLILLCVLSLTISFRQIHSQARTPWCGNYDLGTYVPCSRMDSIQLNTSFIEHLLCAKHFVRHRTVGWINLPGAKYYYLLGKLSSSQLSSSLYNNLLKKIYPCRYYCLCYLSLAFLFCKMKIVVPTLQGFERN